MSSWIQKCTSAKKEEVQSTNTGRTQDVCRHMGTHIIPIYKRLEMLASPWFERLGRPHSAQSSQVSHPTSMPAIRRCVYKSEKHLQYPIAQGKPMHVSIRFISWCHVLSSICFKKSHKQYDPRWSKSKTTSFLFLPVAP